MWNWQDPVSSAPDGGVQSTSKDLSQFSLPSSPRVPHNGHCCQACMSLLNDIEADVSKMNALTADLSDKISAKIIQLVGANGHGSAHCSVSHMSSGGVIQVVPASEEPPDSARIPPRDFLNSVSLVTPTSSGHLHVGSETTRHRLSTSSKVVTDEDLQQLTRSHMVKSGFIEGGRPVMLQLPRALWKRSMGVEQPLKSFAPQDVTEGRPKMRSSSNEAPVVSTMSTRRGNKLKLHALWEEAYAMADDDIDIHPMGLTTHKLWAHSSVRTGMLNEPQEWGTFRKRLANPHSHMHIGWDCLALLLISYDLASIPIEIAWDLPMDGKGTAIWLVAAEIAYWTLDMGLSFVRGFYDKGMLVWNTAQIRNRYLKNWFAFDLLLILVDCILVISRSLELTGLVRLTMWVRLIRMGRVLKMTLTARKLEEVCGTWSQPSASLVHAVIYTFAMISLLTHMIACAWFYIGMQGARQGKDNWIDASGLQNEEMGVEYVYCFHWVLGQFTPAPMKIGPANTQERLFTIIVIFFTLFVLGKGYQKMSHTLQELNAARHDGNRMRRHVQQWLAMHKVPLELSVRTTRFADFVLSRRAHVELDVSLVSEHLRRELTMHQRQGYLMDHPLFKLLLGGYPDSISNICEALQPRTYDKGRAIFASGSVARCLYITYQGTYHIDIEHYAESFSNTRYLAEVCLYSSVTHTSTLHAITFCDAFTFTASDFKRCVQHDPGCSRLVLEYANGLLGQLRRDTCLVSDIMSPDKILHAVESTKCYRILHADPDAVSPPRSDRELSDAFESEGEMSGAVLDFLERLKAGQVPEREVAVELERLFIEVDPVVGVYARLLYEDERVRTLVSMVNTLWLWTDKYEAFTSPQAPDKRLSYALWRKLQLFVHWVDPSKELMHAILVMVAIRGIGNVAPLVKELPKSHQRTSKAVQHMLTEAKRRFSKHIPSAMALPEEARTLVVEAFDIHDQFNLGQFMEGENLPFNIKVLQEYIKGRKDGDRLLKLYLLAIVGVMSGRDMRGDFELGVLPGSRFIDERRGKMIMSCLEVLEHLLFASPQTIFWSYMSWHAFELNLKASTAAELALARLMCLSRSYTPNDVYVMRVAWENLAVVDRVLLTDCLLADGITQRSVRFSYLPMCLANARGNPCVGLGPLLEVLAELLEMVKARGCWGQTDAMTLVLDLQDLASFIVAVNNFEVFGTCLLRAELRQLEDRINVMMTSRNWIRATDSDNHEVSVVANVHSVYQKQRAIEHMLEEITVGNLGAPGSGSVGHRPASPASPRQEEQERRRSAGSADVMLGIVFENDV